MTRPGSSASTVRVVSPAHLSIEVRRSWFLAGPVYGNECEPPVAPSLVVEDGPRSVPLDLGGDCSVGTSPGHPALAVVFGSRSSPSSPVPNAPGVPTTVRGMRAMAHGPVHDGSEHGLTELVVLPDRDAWLRIQSYGVSEARFRREVRTLLDTLRSTGPALGSRVPQAEPGAFVDSYGAHDAFLRINTPTSAFAWFGGGAPWNTECWKLEPIDGGTRLLATVVSATWFDEAGKEHSGDDPHEPPTIGTQQVIELVDHDLIATYTTDPKGAGNDNVYLYRTDDWQPTSTAPCAGRTT